MGILGRLRQKREKPKEHGKSFQGKKEVSFDIEDLKFISALVKPEELKERFEKAVEMLKPKIMNVTGIDVDSQEFKDLIKLRTLRSSNPEMAEKIRQSKEAYSKVYGTKVVMEFTSEELAIIRESIKFSQGPWMDDLRRRLADPPE